MGAGIHVEIADDVGKVLGDEGVALHFVPIQSLVDDSRLPIGESFEIRRTRMDAQQTVRALTKGCHGYALVGLPARVSRIVNITAFKTKKDRKEYVETSHIV